MPALLANQASLGKPAVPGAVLRILAHRRPLGVAYPEASQKPSVPSLLQEKKLKAQSFLSQRPRAIKIVAFCCDSIGSASMKAVGTGDPGLHLTAQSGRSVNALLLFESRVGLAPLRAGSLHSDATVAGRLWDRTSRFCRFFASRHSRCLAALPTKQPRLAEAAPGAAAAERGQLNLTHNILGSSQSGGRLSALELGRILCCQSQRFCWLKHL